MKEITIKLTDKDQYVMKGQLEYYIRIKKL